MGVKHNKQGRKACISDTAVPLFCSRLGRNPRKSDVQNFPNN